ncbi:hypothetical protein T484DRAFT_2469369 [Baffinella frigidus]|nr:hypothetical protein T484DRAFT_2469369 [Cryptophyta sp. CCMP2293]
MHAPLLGSSTARVAVGRRSTNSLRSRETSLVQGVERAQASVGLRMAVGGSGSSQESDSEMEYVPAENCRRLRIQKPLGIVFEEVEAGSGGAVVVQVAEGSNAARAGVKVGETLVACSAATLKAGKEGAFSQTGYGGRPFDNWSIVMIPTIKEEFRTIMAALTSNNDRWGIRHISVVLDSTPRGVAAAATLDVEVAVAATSEP